MRLKPWYDVVKPRQDLCEGRPLDASEFAVHLDKVRLQSPNISANYTDPRRFFERTYLTDNLVKMTGEVVRRLSGITTEASAIFNTMTHMLQRVSKSVILTAESDASEIIRRRLFEWDDRATTPDGRVLLPKEAYDSCRVYADWVQEHRDQLPNLINPDIARDQFLASYPFHPMTISVFERKWSSLPRFQRTRGILRVLALWVSQAYQDGTKTLHRDPMISLGTAPLGNPQFRAAVLEQLGTDRLESAVTTDIVGKKDAHAVRLDAEAGETIKKARLHRKVATAIFFESNGGQVGTEAKLASIAEIRLAVCEPESDIGNIETVLDGLLDACYYLIPEKNRYRCSLTENLNKRFNDRKATIQPPQIDELMRQTISQLFPAKAERVFFPDKSVQIGDRPVLTIVIMDTTRTMQDDKETLKFIDQMTRECGMSSRTFKSALIWVVADTTSPIREEARKLLAWRAIDEERDDLRLDEVQRRQLQQSLGRAERDLKESVWRLRSSATYGIHALGRAPFTWVLTRTHPVR